MPLGSALHQMSGQPERTPGASGEATSSGGRDEARPAWDVQADLGASDLLGQALARQNMARAWKRVKVNKGSAGVDGRTVQVTGEHLKTAWPDIRKSVLTGSWRPSFATLTIATSTSRANGRASGCCSGCEVAMRNWP